MDENYHEWLTEKTGTTCVKNLKNHKFDAHFVENEKEALSLIIPMISNFQTFGFGGSDTTRSIGLIEELESQNKTIMDHNKEGLPFEEVLDLRKKQSLSDCFFCSANAISMTGEIINVDGVGNRTNAMSFGPGKVIIVAGVNKIAKDIESALARIREVAAPMRAKSLNMDTPCAETGICIDCNSPMRICNITTILHRKPMLTDISVIIINKKLGY